MGSLTKLLFASRSLMLVAVDACILTRDLIYQIVYPKCLVLCPDYITNKIIRYLLPTLHIIIQDLTNICVFQGYHPRAWKRAWALMIHKLSKRRSDPCSCRPISLLCCLSKVFEAIMTKRLMIWAKNTDQLPTEQGGF